MLAAALGFVVVAVVVVVVVYVVFVVVAVGRREYNGLLLVAHSVARSAFKNKTAPLFVAQ